MAENLKSPSVPPAFIVHFFMKVGNFLENLKLSLMPAPVALIQISTSLLNLRALYLLAKSGITDLLAKGPQTTEELAKATGTHAETLYRVLRACAGIGILRLDASNKWNLTRLGHSVRKDGPDSMRDWLLMAGCEWNWEAFGKVEHTLKSGQTAFDLAHQKDFFAYLNDHQPDAELFNAAMTNFVNLSAPAIAKGYDFSGIKTLMDVAGGHGRLISAILAAHPGLSGIVFDQPEVVIGAKARLESLGLSGRCRTEGGNFFEKVPEGADAYMMRTIIHDWSDEKALVILKNCRKAMPAQGKLLLVEMVVPAGNDAHPSKVLDLAMLWLTGGKERTEGEYRDLLFKAGFKLTRIVPTASPECIIEAVAI